MKITQSRLKHKMSSEELAIHLHVQRKGGVSFKDKSKYSRKQKYKNNY